MKELILNILLTIDRSVIEFIKIPQDMNINSNQESLEELSKIVKRAKENNVFIGVLGSWALTMHLNKKFKNVYDIDLMTDNDSMESLKKLFLELGYKEATSNWPNMCYFEKNGIGIDIHSIDNKKHIYYGLSFKIDDIRYQGRNYPVVSKDTLYQMYKRVFMKPKRSIKKDLVKFKILNNIRD